MKIQHSKELKTMVLPMLLGVALLVSLTLAACGSGSTEDTVSDEPVAEADAEGHDDDAGHGGEDANEDSDTETHDGTGHDDAADDHEDDMVADHDEPEEFVVTMTDQLTYGPEEIVVPAGQPVRLVISNDGSALHDFTVDEMVVTHMHHEGGSMDADHMSGEGHDEFDLHMALDGGEAGVLEFIPGEQGEYVFHCTVPGHTENGMHGELVVRAVD